MSGVQRNGLRDRRPDKRDPFAGLLCAISTEQLYVRDLLLLRTAHESSAARVMLACETGSAENPAEHTDEETVKAQLPMHPAVAFTTLGRFYHRVVPQVQADAGKIEHGRNF